MNWMERAERTTVTGAHTLSKRASGFPVGSFPVALECGEGAHVKTTDGKRMIDWICALGANTLGLGHRAIVKAVDRQIRLGSVFSLPSRVEIEVSERFLASMQAEQVRWVSTGSESCAAAMRIARAATGRDIIVTSDQSYHGWLDGFLGSKPVRPGVPDVMGDLIDTFRYNDLSDLECALRAHGKRSVAAVMMEPCLFEDPKPGFLEGARQMAHDYGGLFILDEMILGARMAWRGGSEYFNVEADLRCYGKAIGGGLPLGCVVGHAKYMKHAINVSGTFSANTLSLAACQATLDVYEQEPVIEHLWKIGDLFKRGLESQIALLGIPAKMEGYAVHPKLTFTHSDALINRKLMTLWLQEMAEGGVLVHPSGWNVSYAHTEEDVKQSLDASRTAFMACDQAVKRDDWSGIRGKLIEENPFRKVGT